MEEESGAWNPVLHNYFFSMETLLGLLFYKAVGVIAALISLLEHLPRKWRPEFNALLRDIQICFSSSVRRAS